MRQKEEQERVVAYIRVSTSRQVKDGNSLTVQRKQVTDYCSRNHYDLVRSWVEEAETAKTDDRPYLQEMLKVLSKNKEHIKVLIVPKLDRLARNSIDYAGIKKILRGSGIRVESCTEVIEDTPVGRLTESLLASIAQFDNEIRAERSKGGMVQAVHEGRWVWKPPLGYKPVRSKQAGKKRGLGNIKPDPLLAPIIAECFRRIASRTYSIKQTHAWLTGRGLSLSFSSMHRLLRNPAYAGVIKAFGGEFEATPPFVPLVSKERFALVQQLLRRSKNLPEKYEIVNEEYPLRGSLRCPSCTRYMSACWSKGRNARFPYYRCVRCPKVNLPKERVTMAFLNELVAFRPEPALWSSFHDRISVYLEQTSREQQAKSDTHHREIRRLEELRSNMAIKAAEGVIPDDVAKEQLLLLSSQIGDLQEQLTELTMPGSNLEVILAFARDFLGNLSSRWRAIEVAQQKKLQTFFFPDGILIEKDFSLRTDQYPILERVKAVLTGVHFRLVDPSSELPNQTEEESQEVLIWIKRLYEEFGDEEGEH